MKKIIKKILLNVKKIIATFKRKLTGNKHFCFRSVKPISNIFGLDRGTSIDRYYIGMFLDKNKKLIKGDVLEVAESTYSKKYGSDICNYEILHVDKNFKSATIIGDLSKPDDLPKEKVDCFICTQTYNFIYDFKKAIQGSYKLLKKDGVLLATVGGISQISEYDMERWGDYWRFTPLSAKKVFEEVFGKKNVKVECFGNVLAAVSFLEGIAAEELTKSELLYKDKNYPITITIVAKK